jgi:hypothetical protein
MKKAVINIGIDVEDTYFNFPQQVMSDIVDALHNNDTVEIHFTEGVALEELNYKEKKFLQILKEICERNNWPLTKIHFILPNLVIDRSVWPSMEFGNSSQMNNDLKNNFFLRLQIENVKIEKNFQKTFGIFIHRSQWDRVLLSSHLYSKHKNIALQTFHKHLDDPSHMVELGIDQLLWKLSSDKKLDASMIRQLSEFIENLPFDHGTKWTYDNHVRTTWDQTLMACYNNIFVDVVCEKMVTGKTFFPTEKTARALATKTPFLIMAAPNYIKNLRRLGFRSFGDFWDENYDYQQGLQRVESIQGIIDYLANLQVYQLQKLYKRMLPILEHNYKTYHELTPEKIMSTFNLVK